MKFDKPSLVRALRPWVQGQALLLLSLSCVGVAIYAQHVARLRPWPWESPVDLSTGALAAAGLAWTLTQAVLAWRARLPCAHWLFGAAALGMIWAAEVAVDEMPAVDFRIVIAAWAIAVVLLYRCTRPYATQLAVRAMFRLGLASQMVAHGTWFLDDGILGLSAGFNSRLELVTDSGEMVALLGYLAALVAARLSLLDEHARASRRLDVPREAATADESPGNRARVRICFPYIAQLHQMLHSLPLAAALAQRYPQVEVHIAGSNEHLRFARRMLRRHAGRVRIRYEHLARPLGVRLMSIFREHGGKKRTLAANRLYFSGFDAIVTPERTSTYLKRLGIERPRLIGTEHGAGDRAVTFAPETARYDFLLLPGHKQAARLRDLHGIDPARIHEGVYAKIDWTLTDAAPTPRWFDNERPTVLYNPHFDRSLSSWPTLGESILEWFARSQRYNLIFAPHVRLFHPPTRGKYARFRALRTLPHLRIDLGSEHSVDMSYTRAADIYLGDVSSQVVEFLTRPRPCVFINANRVVWHDDPHYRFWHLGPVIEDLAGLESALVAACAQHDALAPRQRDYMEETLGLAMQGGNAVRGADAIIDFLRRKP